MDSVWKETFPRDLFETLLSGGTKEEEIIYGARSDMGMDSHYADGYVIFTKNELVTATLKETDKTVRLFGGYKDSRIKEQEDVVRSWSITTYSVDEIEKLEVQMLVSGGLLYASGQLTTVIAAFTNSCMDDMKRLTKLFGKTKEAKMLMPEDYEQKKKEECCPKCGMRYPNKDRKVCPKCMDKHSIFLRTLLYFKPHRLKILFMLICYIGTAMLNLVWPYLNGTILYDRVLARDEIFLSFVGLPAGRLVTLLGAVVITMILTA
jgi:ATP-binding cassette subfamily B protein